MNELHVYNTRTRKKEPFEPLEEGRVKMYVCGVTVYDYCHLGHARCYVAFDIIHRYLEYLGYRVTYVQNITDLDDKLINRARELGAADVRAGVAELAAKYTAAYFEDMDRLSVLRADHYPSATASIPRMREIISALIEKGFAYRRGGDVYFEVAAFPGYGDLSGKNPDNLRAGARVAVDEKKKSPLDFALWKASSPGEPSWPSPWGEGRPGWHIECSAMSTDLLGSTFDIHGGGQDLVFPHHENERAQSEAFTGKPFARYWLHNGFVTINREKMSKSLGNVFNLRDIFERYQPRVVRFFLLGQHYRSPVDYSEEALEEAKNALERLDNCYTEALEQYGDIGTVEPDQEAIAQFEKAMNDDFNTAAALAVVYQIANEFFTIRQDSKSENMLKAKMGAMVEVCSVLGLELKQKESIPVDRSNLNRVSNYSEEAEQQMKAGKLTKQILESLLFCREHARRDKNWVLADQIRDYLTGKGVTVKDTKDSSSAFYFPEELNQD